jgi:integrase
MKATGRHPEKALSSIKIKNLSKPGRYTDGNGLYLVVDPSAAKRWVLRTVVKGKRSDIGLGSLSLVSLAESREEAAKLRKIARADGDPLAVRRAARRTVPSFEVAAIAVHESNKPSWKNPKHADQWINTLSEYVFPVFGQKAIDQIDSADILKAMNPIWLAKAETARRVLQRIRAVLDWAKASGFRSGDNPVDGVSRVLPKQKDTEIHHAALPYADVPGFIQKLRVLDASVAGRLGFEFTILTAARTSETLNAVWTEIDFENATWTIPAARMKAQREQRIPLSGRCIAILKEARKLSGDNSFVFPGRAADKPLSNMAFLMMLRRMKLDITAHGFRSSFRDWASEQTNFPQAVCEAALAHAVKNKVEAAYNRTDLFEKRRELMTTWAKFCAKAPAKAKPRARSKATA